MNIEDLKVSYPDARAAVRHYANALKERHSEEYATLLRGYHAILRGQRVIDLNASITSAGTDTKGRPHLAVGRADCAWCHVRRESGASVRFASVRSCWREARGRMFGFSVHGFTGALLDFATEYRAMIPLIPPQHSPGATRLREYALLFEADWERAPVDPMLLRPLGGPLYAVVAAWDLTALERAVLYDARMQS